MRDDAGGREIAHGETYEYPKGTPYEMKLPLDVAFSVGKGADGLPVSFSSDAKAASDAAVRFPTISEALDFYYSNQREASGRQKGAAAKLGKLEERLAQQKKTLDDAIGERRRLREAGDAIYSNFERVEEALNIVHELKRQGKGEDEISQALHRLGAKLVGEEIEIEL
jgi:predicted ribosome quality control (RQC) complex YloA/Tae2 family protein